MKKIIIILFLCFNVSIFAQVKIGNNPSQIDNNSLLELESTDKVFVLNRFTAIEMNAVHPLQGALVYNTDAKCIFVFEGRQWKSLCGSGSAVTTGAIAPTTNAVGDIWVDNTTVRNLVNIWNGISWVSINSHPLSGVGEPSALTIENSIPGDIYVDEILGSIYIYNGTDWVDYTNVSTASVDNGISKTQNNVIQLGGTLIKATKIYTDEINTLAINGLEEASDTDAVNFVVVDTNTGILKKMASSTMPSSNLFQEEVVLILAQDGQIQFIAPLPITNPNKVNVYRNGVRIDFTAINSNTIELEPAAVCYENDEIRIVQFY